MISGISKNYIRNNSWFIISNEDIELNKVLQKALGKHFLYMIYKEINFNKYKKNNEKSFEQNFMEKATNELGNTILPWAAEVIIIQFRKFMATQAYNIMYSK